MDGMKIKTRMLGEIEVDEKALINFPDGIPGFKDDRRFLLIPMDGDEGPFFYLQSADNAELCLVLGMPFIFFPDYEIDVADEDLKKLELAKAENLAIYVILTIPDDFKYTTANLLAPVIINVENRSAMQYIAVNSRYTTKHLIFSHALKDAQGAAATGEGR